MSAKPPHESPQDDNATPDAMDVEQDAPQYESGHSADDSTVQKLQELHTERDALFEQLQRVSADYQNYMRRAEQNLSSHVDLTASDLLKRFLPVLDHFDKALQTEPQSDETKALYDGVRIVRDELVKVLQQAGVERIDPQVGEPFDPHRHEAMLQQPAEGVEPNHITLTMQSGYMYKDRTLRAAKVAVAPTT